MGFTFNGIPAAEVTITGEVQTEISEKSLQVYNGYGAFTASPAAGKYWIVVGVASYDATNKLYVQRGGAANSYRRYLTGGFLPMRVDYDATYGGVKNEGAQAGSFSYYEFDV
jgi:hypothetical protein